MVPINWLSYSEICRRERAHSLHTTEIPVEHETSWPLPTQRWGMPAYACFAAPALRRPRQPDEIGAPDRWWLLDARHGRLMLYALWRAMPYATGVHWEKVTLPLETRSVGELRELSTRFEQGMNAVIPSFFAGQTGEPQMCAALGEALRAYLPPPLWPCYQALTPDFFAWLHL
jgi:hypothetical protein